MYINRINHIRIYLNLIMYVITYEINNYNITYINVYIIHHVIIIIEFVLYNPAIGCNY